MKTAKRVIAAVLAAVLVWGAFPLETGAAGVRHTDAVHHAVIPAQVNPLYGDIYSPEDLVFLEPMVPQVSPAAAVEYVTEAEAAAQIREQLKDRVGTITVYVRSDEDDYQSLFEGLFDRALEHTGSGREGDSLRFQYGGYQGSISYSVDSEGYCYTFTYQVPYYTTAAQEAELDEAVEALLAELDLSARSDYEKVCGVYDYICANITYDEVHLNDTAYKLKFTPYAALVDKTAVCQGYALLLYRLLLELGVDTRIVTGIGNGGGHAWNILELNGLYYNADATWDATWHQAGRAYNYFLRNEENFTEGGTDHLRDAEYSTEAFLAAYPMGETDYDPDTSVVQAQGTCGDGLTWVLTGDGVLTISGDGEIENYDGGYDSPFYPYKDQIRYVKISEGVTVIGKYAFQGGYSSLEYIRVPGTVTHIRDCAFGVGYDNVPLRYSGTMAQWNSIRVGEYNYDREYGAECTDGTILYKGGCGDSAKYVVLGDGTLQISGTGAMKFYQNLQASSTWSGDGRIRAVELAEGITTIAGYAFKNCANLERIGIPASVTQISSDAFYGCTALTDVYYGGNEKSWSGISISEKNNGPLFAAAIHYTDLCGEGHDWGQWTVTKEADCTAAGERSHTCLRCDLTETEAIPAAGHSYTDTVQAPTCTEEGYTTHRCSVCGNRYIDSFLDPLGHDPMLQPAVEATCSEPGLTEGSCCSRCGEIMVAQETIPALGHDYVDGACIRCGCEDHIVISGSCGDQVSYELWANGLFRIYGTGSTYIKYSNSGLQKLVRPWHNYLAQIKTVQIDSGVTALGKNMFRGAVNLETVTIADTVESIGMNIFSGCTSLREITFRGEAPDIEGNAFTDVTATAYYPEAAISWTEGGLKDYGGSITWVPYGAAATGWSGAVQWVLSEDGVLIVYGKGNMKNYGYNGGQPWLGKGVEIHTVVIKEGVTAIGTGAFRNLTTLETVELPETGLARIGEAAFYGCSGLKEIDIPDTVYTVFDYTFKNCTALASVGLSDILIKIGQGAFENCTALTDVYIPVDTGIIGAWSFKGCTALEKVDMSEAVATEIREGAFKKCTALTLVKFPHGIEKLGDSAFYGIGAEEITIPATITSVGPWCFARANLRQLSFLGNAPAIGEGAFNKITLTAYYTEGNSTWNAAVMQNYGGAVTWVATTY